MELYEQGKASLAELELSRRRARVATSSLTDEVAEAQDLSDAMRGDEDIAREAAALAALHAACAAERDRLRDDVHRTRQAVGALASRALAEREHAEVLHARATFRSELRGALERLDADLPPPAPVFLSPPRRPPSSLRGSASTPSLAGRPTTARSVASAASAASLGSTRGRSRPTTAATEGGGRFQLQLEGFARPPPGGFRPPYDTPPPSRRAGRPESMVRQESMLWKMPHVRAVSPQPRRPFSQMRDKTPFGEVDYGTPDARTLPAHRPLFRLPPPRGADGTWRRVPSRSALFGAPMYGALLDSCDPAVLSGFYDAETLAKNKTGRKS